MTPEDITEIIMRRLDEAVKDMNKHKPFTEGWRQMAAIINELTELATEIRALKENETKD